MNFLKPLVVTFLSFATFAYAEVGCTDIQTHHGLILSVVDKKVSINGVVHEGAQFDLKGQEDRPKVKVMRNEKGIPISVSFSYEDMGQPYIYEFNQQNGKCELVRETIYGSMVKYDKQFCSKLTSAMAQMERECGQSMKRVKDAIHNFRQELKKKDSDLYYFGLQNTSSGPDIDKTFLNQRLFATMGECAQPKVKSYVNAKAKIEAKKDDSKTPTQL